MRQLHVSLSVEFVRRRIDLDLIVYTINTFTNLIMIASSIILNNMRLPFEMS